MATTTLIENILVKEQDEKGPYEKFFKKDPPFVRHLRIFGEIGIVAYANRKMRSKFSNKGRTCMFVGYTTKHAGDVYRMLDLDTKRITTSRDIRWLDKSYSEWNKEKPIETEDNDNEPSTGEPIPNSDEKPKPKNNVQRQLEIDTHEDIEDVEIHARGQRTLRSGRDIVNKTCDVSDLYMSLVISTVEQEDKDTDPRYYKKPGGIAT